METFDLSSRAELTGFLRTADIRPTVAEAERAADYLDGEPPNPDCNLQQGAQLTMLRASIFRVGEQQYRAFLKS